MMTRFTTVTHACMQPLRSLCLHQRRLASTVEPAHKSQLAVTVPAWACCRHRRGSLARSLASGGAWPNDAWPVSSVHSPLVVCVVVGCAACPLPPLLFVVPVQPHLQIVCTLRSMCMCVSVLEGAGSGRGGAGNEGGRVESESARARMPVPCPRTTAAAATACARIQHTRSSERNLHEPGVAMLCFGQVPQDLCIKLTCVPCVLLQVSTHACVRA